MIDKALFSSLLLVGATPALASPVNLLAFEAQGFGTWTVAPDGGSATYGAQQNDIRPGFFSGPDGAQRRSFEASFRVDPTTSQQLDRIGFVLGLSPLEATGDNPVLPVDYWLIDWQGSNRDYFGAPVNAGLALSHVTGVSGEQIWTHNRTSDGSFSTAPDRVVEEVARATTLGATGWLPGVTYDLTLTFTDSLIEVFVGGIREISYAGSFTDGGFGFMSLGQPGVTFSLASTVLPPVEPTDPIDVAPIPLPAGFPLLFAGLGAFALLRRRPSAQG